MSVIKSLQFSYIKPKNEKKKKKRNDFFFFCKKKVEEKKTSNQLTFSINFGKRKFL